MSSHRDDRAEFEYPDGSGIPFYEWKAAELNELFRSHGAGNITAATLRDGELRQRGKTPAYHAYQE